MQPDPLEHTRYGEGNHPSSNENPIPKHLVKPLTPTNQKDEHDIVDILPLPPKRKYVPGMDILDKTKPKAAGAKPVEAHILASTKPVVAKPAAPVKPVAATAKATPPKSVTKAVVKPAAAPQAPVKPVTKVVAKPAAAPQAPAKPITKPVAAPAAKPVTKPVVATPVPAVHA